MTTINGRTADHPIEPIFLERWSPRAFDETALSETEMMTILEAGRWAPSSYNSQPWTFIYALRGTPEWNKLLGLLIEFNQSWAHRAGALLFMVSSETMQPPGAEKPVPAYSHSFDTGAAWGFIALQALKMGLHTHGMVGFDKERAVTELNVPPGHRVEAAIAIGRMGDISVLPEGLQAREVPSPRKPLSASAFAGGFPVR
jgi:nitroreductase